MAVVIKNEETLASGPVPSDLDVLDPASETTLMEIGPYDAPVDAIDPDDDEWDDDEDDFDDDEDDDDDDDDLDDEDDDDYYPDEEEDRYEDCLDEMFA